MCFMPWLGKLLTTDVFTTTLTSLQMMGEPGGIRIRGPTRRRCQAARTVSGVRAPTQARAHRPLSPLAPALLVRVFKFETCGFSRSSRAPPPPPRAPRREGAEPRANQPSLGGSRPAPGMWSCPARTCSPGPRRPGPARLPVAGVGQVAVPSVQAAQPGRDFVLRAQSRSTGQTGREEAGWAGLTRFPGAGRPGPGRALSVWHRVSYIETKVVPRLPEPASLARSP